MRHLTVRVPKEQGGINVAGAVVFALFGVSPEGTRFARGSTALRWSSLALSTVAFAALLYWQLHDTPDLERSSRARRIEEVVERVIDAEPGAHLVEANARFTRADVPGQETVLIVTYVQRSPSAEGDDALADRVREAIVSQLDREGFRVTPLVDVTVLER